MDKNIQGLLDAARNAYCSTFDPITDSAMPIEMATEVMVVSVLETLLRHGLADRQAVQQILKALSHPSEYPLE